jgi:spore coat protein CotH
VRRSLEWKRHWKLVTTTVAIVAVLVLALGGIRVAAFTSGDAGPTPISDDDIVGTVDLFDPSVVHTIEVTFDPAEYEAAIDAFTQDGEKEYIEADVVIDGTLVEQVGIRLKGNSTLFGLAGDRPGAGREAPALGGSGTASVESPEDLPWLIHFDEFVDGQTYQGHEQVAVRPGGMGSAQSTALNEALSLTLIDLAGEPAEETSYTAFSVNGSDPTLRLLVQHPEDFLVADDFETDGVLYKALSGTDGGSFTYRGEDPLDYADSFRQVTRKNQEDLAPLIEFIRWVQESSDDDFVAGLEDRLDVKSFARYLALHNLLLDSDDMSGPGQNYYLFYDLDTERFTVVTWDANSTFRGDTTLGPFETGTIGGHGGAWQGGLPEGEIPGGGQWQQGGERPEGFAPPEGFTPPEGMELPGGQAGELPEVGELPEGVEPPGGIVTPTDPGDVVRPQDGQGRGFGMGGHLLKERFLEVAEFQALYEEAYQDIYRQLFADGAALEALDRWAAVLSTVEGDLIDAATVEGEVSQLRRVIEARTEALAANEVIVG